MAKYLNILLAVFFVTASAEYLDINVDFGENLPEGFDKDVDSSRVIGGFQARRGQFPYQAALVVNRDGILTLCSGALISNTTVLTTASCVGGATSVDVLLGVQSIRNITEEGRLNIPVPGAHVLTHPGWTGKSSVFDLALVYLTSVIEFNSYIKPVSLPSFSEVTTVMDGVIVYVTGWGRVSNEGDYGIADQLRYATVRFQSYDSCKHFYGNSVFPTNICLQVYDGKGGCRGDEGSPAVTNNKLYGLLSFTSPQGCVKCLPTVLTKITYFLDWIEANSDVVIRL